MKSFVYFWLCKKKLRTSQNTQGDENDDDDEIKCLCSHFGFNLKHST